MPKHQTPSFCLCITTLPIPYTKLFSLRSNSIILFRITKRADFLKIEKTKKFNFEKGIIWKECFSHVWSSIRSNKFECSSHHTCDSRQSSKEPQCCKNTLAKNQCSKTDSNKITISKQKNHQNVHNETQRKRN